MSRDTGQEAPWPQAAPCVEELLHVPIEGPVGIQQGILAIFILPTYFMGRRVLPSSGSEKNIHSGAQALAGQEGPNTDGRTME